MIESGKLVEIAHAIARPQESYLKYKSIVDRYDRGAKAKLAQIVNRLRPTVEKPSQALLESLAYGTEEWQGYLDEWAGAERHMIKSRVKFDNLKCLFDAYQSEMAYEREGMKRGVV